MEVSLLKALRTVIRADSDPLRQALFASLRRGSLPVRIAAAVHGRLGRTWASTALVSGYGLKSFLTIAPPRRATSRVLSVAVHANARRQLERAASWIEPDQVGRVGIGLSTLVAPSGLARIVTLARSGRRGMRSLRLLHSINLRHPFLVSCRVASTLACYARAEAILGARPPKAVLFSSDSNPEEVGFAAAARALGIPTIFVSHAYTTPVSPPLDFSLSILEGEAAVEAHRRKGKVKGAIVLAGVEGESAPLDARRLEKSDPVIGIFAPKTVVWPTLAAIIRDCRRRFRARQVVIRWHPSMLERPRLDQAREDASVVSESAPVETLPEVARRCDWVIAAEDSNVHLPVLKLGIPTVAVKGLSEGPESRSDLYGFVANGIVFPPVPSVDAIPAEAVIAFYSVGWPDRFRRYDASYLRPQKTVDADVRDAMRRLLGE